MPESPSVYVIVLNYNGKSHLEYCLPSILSTNYENLNIVLVDNNSSDGSVEYVERSFPSVEILQLEENLGWAGGNNRGIEYANEQDAEYVLLANNDIRVHPEWVSAAVDAAESRDDVGFVGFDVYGVVKSIPLETYEEAVDEWTAPSVQETEDYINGMAIFAPIDVFDDIGLIDERYFIYAEETDLQIRAEKAGYKRLRTNVPVWHHSSGTMGDLPLKSSFYAIRNRIRLGIKHESPLQFAKSLLSLYNTGCNPLLDYDSENQIYRRRRPRGVVFNFFFITFCLFWNLVHLWSTLRAKRRDYEKIRSE